MLWGDWRVCAFETPRSSLDKISCTRQFESKLSLRSFAKSLDKRRIFRKSPRPSLPLKRAPPLISVFSPQGRRGKPLLLVARNRYALRLADHQRSRQVCGMGPPDYDLYHIFYMLCSESHYLSVNDFLSKFVQSSFIPILYNLLFLCI